MDDALFYPGNLCYTKSKPNFVRYHMGLFVEKLQGYVDAFQ